MNVSPSGVANSSVPDNVITNCGSGSGCQSYEECAGVSLKWMAITSVRAFSSIVPSSTCDALSAPVYNLNARTIFLSPWSLSKIERHTKNLQPDSNSMGRQVPRCKASQPRPRANGEG